MRITQRLLSTANMLEGVSRVADIGCDHGKLSVYLAKNGFRVIAADESEMAVVKTTLLAKKARAELDIRRGDGLSVLAPGEVDACVIAGLGGREILKIILDGADMARLFRFMVLQPMQRQDELRSGLSGAGFAIVRDEIAEDAGRLFELLRVKSGEAPAFPPGWPPGFFELGWQSVINGDPLAGALISRRIRELEKRIAQAGRSASGEAKAALQSRLERYMQVKELYEGRSPAYPG